MLPAVNYLSVCSGIEAATTAWHPLGWNPLAFAEVEAFPSAVLAHHWPDVPNLGDMTKFADWPVELLAGTDILVGGTPCQAFSVAGLRRSLDDDRGNLTLTYLHLLDRIDEERNRLGRPPTVCVWENVPGVLNTRDNAFGCFLGGLAGESIPLEPPGGKWTDAGYVRGPQRTVAWRILDAQYFGLAQRRRRVFVVASARDGFDPSEVLFEREGLRRDSAPCRETGEGSIPDVEGCLGGSSQQGGFRTTDLDNSGAFIPDVVGTLSDGAHYGGGLNGQDAYTGRIIPVVCPTLRAGGNSTGGDRPPGTDVDTCESLIPVAFKASHFTRGKDGSPSPVAPPLSADADKGGQDILLAFDARQSDVIQYGDISGPVDTDGHSGAAAFETRFARNGRGAPSEVVPPLKAQSGQTGKGDSAPCVAMINMQGSKGTAVSQEDGPSYTIMHGHDMHAIATAMQVRRLTPLECERLQGFPRHHTLIPWRGKPADQCPDGPRYRALGNSMAVTVMLWIGERIARLLMKP